MEIIDRITILTQAAELAQKSGILTFDDAITAKQSIDVLKQGKFIKEGLTNLKLIAEKGQAAGAYTLKDAFYIFQAVDGIENIVIAQPEPQPQPTQTIGSKKTKKGE